MKDTENKKDIEDWEEEYYKSDIYKGSMEYKCKKMGEDVGNLKMALTDVIHPLYKRWKWFWFRNLFPGIYKDHNEYYEAYLKLYGPPEHFNCRCTPLFFNK